ncbi:MAG: heme exporter protein CcmD [Hyphomicrobiaceae bacterium]
MDLGPHAIFIWLSYAAVLVVIVGLIAFEWLTGLRLKQELADLEAQGTDRTSQRD